MESTNSKTTSKPKDNHLTLIFKGEMGIYTRIQINGYEGIFQGDLVGLLLNDQPVALGNQVATDLEERATGIIQAVLSNQEQKRASLRLLNDATFNAVRDEADEVRRLNDKILEDAEGCYDAQLTGSEMSATVVK